MILKSLRFFAYWTAVGALGVLVISAVFKPETLPQLPVCSFKQAVGRPCPGCGLTRSFCAISHGRFADAAHFNPFGFILYGMTIALALWPLILRVFPGAKMWLDKSRVMFWFLPSLLGCMVVYGVYRIVFGPYV